VIPEVYVGLFTKCVMCDFVCIVHWPACSFIADPATDIITLSRVANYIFCISVRMRYIENMFRIKL